METKLTVETQEVLAQINQVVSLLKKGQFIEAMEEYLDDNVKLYEGNNPPKIGKELCLEEERKLLSTVEKFHGYKILSGPAAKDNTSFYEAIMEFRTNDGVEHKFEQVVRTEWLNGKIISERYYHT